MKATITFNMDSGAFEDEAYETVIELGKILERLADDIDRIGASRPGDFCPVVDSNGKTIGRFIIQDGTHESHLKMSDGKAE